MKHAIIFLLFLLISTVAFGQAAPPLEPKWCQMPDMFGYDWSSETIVPSVVADDWLCENGMPINQIDWWGSYYEPAVFPYNNSDNWPDPTIPSNTPPGSVTGFYIAIFSNKDDGECHPWPTPGDLLYLTQVDIQDANETLFGVSTKPGGQTENVWQYSVELPEYFYQEQGKIYWLAIMAIDGGDWQPMSTPVGSIYQWGWHQTDKLQYGWGGDAVQLWQFDQEDSNDDECQPWDLLVDAEMAFKLYTIPEPSTIGIVAASMTALGLLLRKRS